ncbi:MAG: hypothetical protein K8S55_12115 [Phycisphaerae bacterium]|nr:hypothetical protein [Phycisphaerae bacterium]
MNSSYKYKILMIVAVGLTAVVAGCGDRAMQIAQPSAVLPADEDSAAFLDRVSSCSTVNEDDATRGLLILLDGKDTSENFQQRVEKLRSRNIVASSWNFDGDKPITRGKFAYMIYQAAKIPGGVMLQLTGPSQRYCLRELQYQEVMDDGFPLSPVTGIEFVGVLNNADTYIRTGKIPDKAGRIDEN